MPPSGHQGTSSSSGYSVGRGPFHNASSSGTFFTLDDIKRKVVKFVNAEDDSMRSVDLANCEGGLEIMEKVLRKFGKWNGINPSGDIDSDDDDDMGGNRGLAVDGWGIYLEGPSGEGTGES